MSELPFLKNKNKGGGCGPVETMRVNNDGSSDLTMHVANELMDAIHSKDLKSVRESLEALVLLIKDKDRGA